MQLTSSQLCRRLTVRFMFPLLKYIWSKDRFLNSLTEILITNSRNYQISIQPKFISHLFTEIVANSHLILIKRHTAQFDNSPCYNKLTARNYKRSNLSTHIFKSTHSCILASSHTILMLKAFSVAQFFFSPKYKLNFPGFN